MPIKIVVADDKAAVRLGIIQMLKTDTDLEVAGEATTFAETLELVDSLKPDIVVLDLHMPDEKNYLPESVRLQSARELEPRAGDRTHVLVSWPIFHRMDNIRRSFSLCA
jgi:DNA-binding NarL/FixJ family response regulator